MSPAGVSGARPLALVIAPWRVSGISMLASSLYSEAPTAMSTSQKTPVSGGSDANPSFSVCSRGNVCNVLLSTRW